MSALHLALGLNAREWRSKVILRVWDSASIFELQKVNCRAVGYRLYYILNNHLTL